MGFVQGASNPCCFKHPKWKLALVVHGDDFTCLGTDHNLNKYEAATPKELEVELRGRLGTDPSDAQEMKILNRVVRVTPRGLSYEADPRHAELLAKSMGVVHVEGRRITHTPGDKDCDEDQIADNALCHGDEAVKVMSLRDYHRIRTKTINGEKV